MSRPIALVTGGSRGLGRSIAHALAARGHAVAITWRTDEAHAAEVVDAINAAGGAALALQLDVAEHARFETFVGTLRQRLLEEWNADALDVLVNNAGHGQDAAIGAITAELVDALFAVHFKGPLLLTQALLPLLRDGGNVVNVSSGLARFALPTRAAYGSMKGAVEVLTRYMALELGPRRIRANVVAPGAIATDFNGGLVRDNPQVNAALASRTALGRVGEADDIGGVVAALVSDDMRWVNGQRIEASGGFAL